MLDPANPNVQILQPPSDGEEEADDHAIVPVVKSIVETIDPCYDPEKAKLPTFSPDKLLGRTFLHNTPDGQHV